VETFDSATALDRFRHGVYNRDDVIITQTQWPGDPATTTRTIHRNAPDESFYVCEAVNGDVTKGHVMVSIGDTSGYSIAWFKPSQTFNGQTTVSWDVNVTYLGTTRQWWEMIITPVSAPDLQCDEFNTACGLGTGGYAAGTVELDVDHFTANGVSHDPWSWQNYCFQNQNIDPEGCASKAIRRTFTMTDNRNGTITTTISGVNRTFTYPGQFPTGDWKVVFKAHAYTPTKGDGSGCGGPCPGYTWHLDNLIVR
jgi:hypothetical protein